MVGDSFLFWDHRREPKGAHKKFDSLWSSLFLIKKVARKNSFYLTYLDGTQLPLPIIGKILNFAIDS